MKAITFNDTTSWLSQIQTDSAMPAVILIYGDSFLVNETLDAVCQHFVQLIPSLKRVEFLDGNDMASSDVVEELSTFSFFSAHKVIALRNIQWCSAAGKPQQENSDDIHGLVDLISKGLPDQHYLLMTAGSVDKRKVFFKQVQNSGQVIDCTIPQGSRKKDLEIQEQIFRAAASRILARQGKEIVPPAFNRLIGLTGLNLELFARNLEKLVAFAGKNQQILPADVDAVVVRDRKDPLFDLTNAVLDKNIERSLFVLNSLLESGFHELQILRTLENQIRKLLTAKCTANNLFSGTATNFKQMGFNNFKSRFLPKIVEQDTQILYQDKALNDLFVKGDPKNKKKISNDLLLAPNPKNAYPVYQLFLKSENFSIAALCAALQHLGDLDYQLKTSASEAKILIENLIIQLCSKRGFGHVIPEDQDRRNHL